MCFVRFIMSLEQGEDFEIPTFHDSKALIGASS